MQRPVSTVERYHIARRNVGHPYIITVLITYLSTDAAHAAPTEGKLQSRILLLQQSFPHLAADLKEPRSAHPYWEQGLDRHDILERRRYTETKEVEEGILAVAAASCGVERGPLWKVMLHNPSNGSGPVYLTVSVAHELADGRGVLRLTTALLNDEPLPQESLLSTKLLHETVNITSSWSYWLPRRALQLAQAYLPAFITTYLDTPVWPASQVATDHLLLPGRLAVHTLDQDLVSALKSLSLYQGIPTLTPVLELAFLVAIWHITSEICSLRPYVLSVATPIDERDPSLGHAFCTGQYTSSHLFALEMKPDLLFWSTARSLAFQLAHPASRITARMNIGMLDSISSGSVHSSDPRKSTGMEAHLLDTAASSTPFAQSISFSNLGRTELPANASDLLIAGSPSIGDPPWEVVLCGHQGGIRLCTAYRDGAAMKQGTVERVLMSWAGVLRGLVVDGAEVDLGSACRRL